MKKYNYKNTLALGSIAAGSPLGAMIWLLCKRKPEPGPKTPCSAFRDTAHSLLRIIPIILLFLFVICGVFFGFFTTTESGAFGAFGAIIIGAVTRKSNGKSLKRAIMETALLQRISIQRIPLKIL